jgi:ubiquinone/menaquinone biosynthesis C-methylase UbiE
MGGISFDRASDYYDATRRLPDDVAARVTDLLFAELDGRGLSLEIGVGTGRIALPLAERGIDLVGVDLSQTMLSRLVAKVGGKSPVGLVTADATNMPLADSSVGAVVGCHVLHLISDWPRALGEVRRVLRPSGLLLLDFGGPTPKPWSDGCDQILRRHGVVRARPGVSDPEPVASYLQGGARVRALPPIRFSVETSLAEELAEWESQILAWTWPYAAEQMRDACDEIRAAASSRGWAMQTKVRAPALVQWWAFDLLP